MLDTDRAGDGICGLCPVGYMYPGDRKDATGEYIDFVVVSGEPRSVIV